MNSKDPYISIVITSRNDNYQGASFQRLQLCISTLIDQAKRYGLLLEVIVVDWNPPEGKPLLQDSIALPKELGLVKVRYIVVPPALHKKYQASQKVNIIFADAVNVGIRRARGKFVSSLTADILCSDELIQFLALEKLDKKFFYRVNRFDIDRKAIQYASSPKILLDFCKKNVVKAHLRENNIPFLWWRSEYPLLHTNGGDFILIPRESWQILHGWPELNNIGLCADRLLCYMAYLSGLKERLLESPMRLYHIDHDSRWKPSSEPKNGFVRLIKKRVYKALSDDSKIKIFIRDAYRGLCRLLFLFSGIKSNTEKSDFNVLFLDLEYEKVLYEMLKKKRSYVYNNENWGLSKEIFRESFFSDEKL